MMLGDPSLVALITALSTVSTSGVTVGSDGFAPAGGIWSEMVIALFLVLALSRRFLPGRLMAAQQKPLWDDPELRLAAFIIFGLAAVLFVRDLLHVGRQGEAVGFLQLVGDLWGSVFTLLSFLTTSGTSSTFWHGAGQDGGLGTPGLLLVGLTMIGGGVATTAGGIKLLRVYALFRQVEHELDRLVHPNLVGGAGEYVRRLRQEGAHAAWIFFMIFGLTIFVAVVALSLSGVAFVQSIILSVAALTNTGPLAMIAGPTPIAYAGLSSGAQAVLAIMMVAGRLEILALLALFAPDSWRK
jgi:trk system potassium uptake protein